jgi:hypothetical protein
MFNRKISAGTAHKMPSDLNKTLTSSKEALKAWESLTPLARNEWICWVENAKLIDTRKRRIDRTKSELKEGIRRPCCWLGCVHRSDKAMSRSQKFVTGRQSRSK